MGGSFVTTYNVREDDRGGWECYSPDLALGESKTALGLVSWSEEAGQYVFEATPDTLLTEVGLKSVLAFMEDLSQRE